MTAKVDLTAAEVQQYVTEMHDTDCTLAQYLAEMELNEVLEKIYAAGKWRGPPPVISPDTPETREWVRRAYVQAESKRAGAEFMRRFKAQGCA